MFIDLEYDLDKHFIFLIGLQSGTGKVTQWFAKNRAQEKRNLKRLAKVLEDSRLTPIAYGSKGADVPAIRHSAKRHAIPFEAFTPKRWVDLFNDVLNTRRFDTQRICLPIKEHDLCSVATHFGHIGPVELELMSGYEAPIIFYRWKRSGRSSEKQLLLDYSKLDLERTRWIFRKLARLLR